MPIHLLPESICGMDTDDLLAYTTPKVTYVRDRYVGAGYYCLTSLAMCWVLIGQVMWRNEHFLLKDVKGIPRMFISHPTKNQCDANKPDCIADFKSMAELPYCLEHEGGPTVPHPAHCKFADKHSMFTDGTVGGQVFIPTSSVVIEEDQECQPSADNNYRCANEYKKTNWGGKGYYFNETNMQFYANIEDYTVQFTSTYHREEIAGTSLDHPGFYSECADDKYSTRGKLQTWKQRLAHGHEPCKDEKRMPIDCIEGLACAKRGLKEIKIKAPDLDDARRIHEKSMKAHEQLVTGIVEDTDDDKDESESAAVSLFRKTTQQEREEEDETGDDVDVQIPGIVTSSRFLRMRSHLGGRSSLIQKPEFDPKKEEQRPTPDVYASTWGDTFKVGKLMQLANVDMDRHMNMDKFSARMAGTVVEVEVTYSNLRRFLSSFGLSQVQYTYRVKERKLPYVSRESLHPEQPEDYPKRRRYLVQHGILLDFKVGGEFGFFSIVYLLIMLTTSMALLATAHKITDLFAMYVHPRKNNYFHLKYEVSADFSDMWRCSDCGYYNLATQESCQGMEKWLSPHDSPYCGCARPADWVKPSHD